MRQSRGVESMDDQNAKLVSRCLRGSTSAFEPLYAANSGRVTAYFRRCGFVHADADDLTQDTFARAFKSLRTFDASRGSFRTWLSAIARNVARKNWSRSGGEENFDPQLAEETWAAPDNPHSSAEVREEIEAVGACVESLPAKHARLVHLRYMNGQTTRGIAATLDMPEATVRLHLSRAQELLEECLRNKGILK